MGGGQGWTGAGEERLGTCSGVVQDGNWGGGSEEESEEGELKGVGKGWKGVGEESALAFAAMAAATMKVEGSWSMETGWEGKVMRRVRRVN